MVWIDEHLTPVLHGILLAQHGGATGVRDEGLLKSELARPLQHIAYGSPENGALDVQELAALYTSGIVRNHPFIDGNKRTGFVVGILFLELNGYRFTASEEEATRAVLDLAAGKASEAEYHVFLKNNSAASQG